MLTAFNLSLNKIVRVWYINGVGSGGVVVAVAKQIFIINTYIYIFAQILRRQLNP